MLGYCTHERFVEHLTGPHHPERPDRMRAIWDGVDRSGLLSRSDVQRIAAAPADARWLQLVHSERYIERIRHVCTIGGGVLDQGDTPVCPDSYDVALLAVGALLACCDSVMKGEVQRAFAAVRPPGHHAEPDRPMGFCLFSNIAIAAHYVQQQYGVKKIAIVDFDVHHGNGTQAAFESDPSVLFISLHQHPRTCYPGSGHEWETGMGAGEGFTVNIPLAPGGGDEVYLETMKSRVLPALDAFRPELLMISAGFDAHRDDPLAGMEVSDDGFEQMTRLLVAAANRLCSGKIVSTLEGGYNLSALGRCVVRHLTVLAE